MSDQPSLYETLNGNKCVYNPLASQENQTREESDKTLIFLSDSIEVSTVYACQNCDLTFKTSEESEHHNSEMHGQRKVITCAICTATFRRQDHLKRHMQSLHFNEKYSCCPVCGKDCKRQDILTKHLKKRHTTSKEIFHCRVCSFECHSLSDLKNHENTHLLTERHVCQHCQAMFKRKDHMLRHIKSQHLNHCIVCPVCNQKYKRKDHVVRHVREKHRMGFLNGKLVQCADIV